MVEEIRAGQFARLRSAEETAKLGNEIIERIEPSLRPEHDDKFVAVDVEIGDYEIDGDDYAAVSSLRARRPSADIWLGRVGQPTAYLMGNGR